MENKIGKIIITKQVSDIIDTLHNKIGAKEWSGVLFYTLKSGKIQNLKDLVFEAVEEKQEETQPQDPKEVLKKIEEDIINTGGDPILTLINFYKTKKDYIEFPFIMGKNWDNEVVINAVRQKLNK